MWKKQGHGKRLEESEETEMEGIVAGL